MRYLLLLMQKHITKQQPRAPQKNVHRFLIRRRRRFPWSCAAVF